ncbi:MAG: TfoX/Sxy family protein [Sideroxydans sp.]
MARNESAEAKCHYNQQQPDLGTQFQKEAVIAAKRVPEHPLAWQLKRAVMTADFFRDFALERLATLDSLCCKRMFGGYGSYSGGVFFGIVFDGWMHFKMHPGTLQDYLTESSCRCFCTIRKADFKELPPS